MKLTVGKSQVEITNLQVLRFGLFFTKKEGCWLWSGSLRTDGYGRFCVGKPARKSAGAHRVAYLLHYGIDPGVNEVCHTCDNTKCVNPEHLFAGSKSDNMKDCVSKGRNVPMVGETNGKAKLSKADVLNIRDRYAAGDAIKYIARIFGVNHKTVRDIVKLRSWKHL